MSGFMRVAKRSSNAITIEATTTAAAGLGRPMKCWLRTSCLVTLKRASLRAAQSKNQNAAIQPNRPNGFNTQE